jgi:hypothetical protein
MTTRQTSSAIRQKKAAAVPQLSVVHRLDALLQTMRCIAQHEDALCELSHETRRTGSLSAETSDELRRILERLPAEDYVIDVDAVRAVLGEPRRAMMIESKSSLKTSTDRQGSGVVKKTGRKPSK